MGLKVSFSTGSIAILFSCFLLSVLPVLSAHGTPEGWPVSISGPGGFRDLGRAIARERDFPINGSEIEKAKYVFSKLPQIATVYGLKAGNGSKVSDTVIGTYRLIETDPEGAGALKSPPHWGNCGEWSYAFSETLGGAGVQNQVVFGDHSPNPGHADAFTGTDTTVMVVEVRPDNTVSRRIFDPFQSAYTGRKSQPSYDSIKRWSDLPMNDADLLPGDEKYNVWLHAVGKEYVKDASTEKTLSAKPGRQAYLPPEYSACIRVKWARSVLSPLLDKEGSTVDNNLQVIQGVYSQAEKVDDDLRDVNQILDLSKNGSSGISGSINEVKQAAERIKTNQAKLNDAGTEIINLRKKVSALAEVTCQLSAKSAENTDPGKKALLLKNAKKFAEKTSAALKEIDEAADTAKNSYTAIEEDYQYIQNIAETTDKTLAENNAKLEPIMKSTQEDLGAAGSLPDIQSKAGGAISSLDTLQSEVDKIIPDMQQQLNVCQNDPSAVNAAQQVLHEAQDLSGRIHEANRKAHNLINGLNSILERATTTGKKLQATLNAMQDETKEYANAKAIDITDAKATLSSVEPFLKEAHESAKKAQDCVPNAAEPVSISGKWWMGTGDLYLNQTENSWSAKFESATGEIYEVKNLTLSGNKITFVIGQIIQRPHPCSEIEYCGKLDEVYYEGTISPDGKSMEGTNSANVHWTAKKE